jgi:ArsR family transcriptional regulator, arsenate/arsenite/antimonite-responsive transcriptional repressor
MKTTQVIEALGALAHEHRLKVYRLLIERGSPGLPAGAIADGVGLVPSSLTFHLQALHRAGLIVRRRESRQLIYSADFEAMNALVGYLTENCCAGSGEAHASEPCGAACKPSAAPKTVKRSRAA